MQQGATPLQDHPAVSRLNLLLRGRSPWKWGASVGLSSGAVSRLLKGRFPDPEKLTAACRIEGLSLTWWLTGEGSPYVVTTATSDAEGAAMIAETQKDLAHDVLLAQSPSGITVVLYSPAAALAPQNRQYRACSIFGGVAAGPLMLDQAMGTDLDIHATELHDDERQRLAGGRMGPVELFELSEARPFVALARVQAQIDAQTGVAEARQNYRPEPILTEEARHLALLWQSLDEFDRESVLRLIRGLSRER